MILTVASFIHQKLLIAHLIVMFLLLTACTTQPIEPKASATVVSAPTKAPVSTKALAIPPTQVAPTIAAPTATAIIVEPTITASPAEPATATAPPITIEPSLDPVDQRVEIEGIDGLTLVGDFRSTGTQPQPTVLLLHMLNNRRQSWQPLVPELLAAGYTVLAIDMRGHGETGGAMEWNLAEQDLQIVLDWLREQPQVDGSQISTIGASIGANMALRSAANDADVVATVILSAGTNYRGVTTEDALALYGNRPILIVAAEGDVGAAQSARTLDSLAVGEHDLIIYDGGGHGTGLFAPHPEVIPAIIDFLAQHVE